MLSEIGSNFWIKPSDLNNVLKENTESPKEFGVSGDDYIWMSTGRSALSIVLDQIERLHPNINKIALIPSFTCHTVIKPFLSKGYLIKTYHVDKKLMTLSEDIHKIIKDNDVSVFLFHKYFGVDTIPEIDTILNKLKEKGVITIEDCTQSLYSEIKSSFADYYVGSIRKWCGVPDGGFALIRKGNFEVRPTEYDVELEDAKVEAALAKYSFLFEGKGDKKTFLDKFRKAEDILDSQKSYYTISKISAKIQSNLNIEWMKIRRRNNYKVLADNIKGTKGIKLIKETLDENEVPLYCPIICENRNEIQKELVRNSIYAPVVWPKALICPEIDEDANYLYDHLLCIPIDQRYDSEDMKKVINVLITKK